MGKSYLSRSIVPWLATVFLSGCGFIGYTPVIADSEADASVADVDAAGDSGDASVTAGTWMPLGTSSSGGGISESGFAAGQVKVSANPNGTVYVAWTDDRTGDYDVYMRYFDGTNWLGLGGSDVGGGISDDDDLSRAGSVTFDNNGNPGIAWQDNTLEASPRSIYYRQWTGTAWSELGGSATSRGISLDFNTWWPSIAHDRDNHPVSVWEAFSVPTVAVNGVVYLRQFDGQQWIELDGSATDGGVSGGLGDAQGPKVATAANGNIYVSWTDNRKGTSNVYLLEWNGTSWNELGASNTGGGISQSTTAATRVSMALTRSGQPVLAWTENEDGAEPRVFLRKWNGSVWQELGSSAADDGVGGRFSPSLYGRVAIDGSDEPVVIWVHARDVVRNVYGARWNGSEWIEINRGEDGISNSRVDSEWPTIAASDDGRVVIGWSEKLTANQSEAYLLSY